MLACQVEVLQHYDGDREKLGNAEKFFLKLLELPAYRFRLEVMLAKAELPTQLSAIRPHITLVNSLCRRLYDNASLKKFLRLVLQAGNFINQVSVVWCGVVRFLRALVVGENLLR